MTLSRILSVDDHEPFRRLTYSLLEKRPEFQIVGQASDGLEAIQKAEELQPDLILLDIGLPKLNGMEAAKRIRIVAPNTKILFVSQESDSDVVGEALQLGAKGYVLKSNAGSELLPAIEAALGGEQFVSRVLERYESHAGKELQGPHRHAVLFCPDEAAIVTGLTRFIAAALWAGDAAIVWAAHSHRDSIRRSLEAGGLNVDAAIQRGIYISSDISERPDRTRIVQAIRGLSEAASKAGKGHPWVAVCGERAGRLWAEGKLDDAIRLEQLLNDLAKVHKIDILCTYPGVYRDEDDHRLKSICAEHSAVYSQ
jgi:DNA-binding NarL/FixJ family response regulator